jgi:hypothetical protein
MSSFKIIKFKKKKILSIDPTCFLITEVNFDMILKKPIDFCVLLVFYENESIYEIIKFDGKHGFCHVHKYFEKLNVSGLKCLPSEINSDSIRYYKKDILDNWKEYLKKYRLKHKI